MRYFPIFLDLEGKTVLVAGGGNVAANKLRLFAKTEARLRCAALDFDEEINDLVASGRVEVEHVAPIHVKFDDAFIVVAATESEIDEDIARRAQKAGLLVNAVDKTRFCTFITPSIVDRGSVAVGIGTEGTAPVLARRLREQVEIALPDNLGALAEFIGKNRGTVGAVLPNMPQRRAFWEAVIDGEIGKLVLSGHLVDAESRLAEMLASKVGLKRLETPARITIIVSPEKPDDLTIKALRALQDADLIIVGRAVPDAVIDRARRDAERRLFNEIGAVANEIALSQAGGRKRIVCLLNPKVTMDSISELSQQLHADGFHLDICAVAIPAMADSG